jgi:hypothetical protein
MQADGRFPENTLNYKAICRLKKIADKEETETD